jgi:hypothetical protein
MPAQRKTVPVDALRELLGNDKTDELLDQLTPPPPTVRVQAEQLRIARRLYADPLAESKQWDVTVAVVRRYFMERGQARRSFLDWVAKAQDSPEVADANSHPAPRPRRKVTDPAVLEKRRAALAKARAVRAEKLKQAASN